MLKHQHLAVIRAALRYMDEEITPHGKDALLPYLDDQDRAAGVAVEHIAETRKLFGDAELNYALVDLAATVIESKRLIPASELDASLYQSDLYVLALVLTPSQ